MCDQYLSVHFRLDLSHFIVFYHFTNSIVFNAKPETN